MVSTSANRTASPVPFSAPARLPFTAPSNAPLLRRTFAILGLTLLFGCQGSSIPSVERGCGGSGQRQPDTSNPVRRRDGSRMSDEALTWEDLVGTEPRTFDVADPREPDDEPALSP